MDDDVRAVETAGLAGQFEEFQGLLQGDVLDQLAAVQAGELAFLNGTFLDISAELAEFGDQLLSVRSDAEHALDAVELAFLERFLDSLVERLVEITDNPVPLEFATCDPVELLFHAGREIIAHDRREVLDEIVGNDHADFLREQLVLFCSDRFGPGFPGDDIPFQAEIDHGILHTFLVALDDIAAAGCQGRNGGIVGRGTADLQLFELLDQGSF